MGDEVNEFEKKLSDFFSRPVICLSNGTAALQLGLQGIGIKQGDEVLVPSLTYAASFQAISAIGAKPIACDIDSENFLIDIHDAQKRITLNTKAVMPVHYTGGADNLDDIYYFAKKNKLRVIEDAAHAFGTVYNDRKIGSFGDVICFSFDGIKNITSGEGGCIVTDDVEVLQKARDARLLGIEKDTEKRYSGERSWDFDINFQGWRYHMSNIMAAIGIVQLSRFSEFAKKRQKFAKLYDSLLKNHSSIKIIPRDYNTVVPHIYVIRILGLRNRQHIEQSMLNKGIQIGYHYQPNHWTSFYKNTKTLPLPVTDSIANEILTLPLHPDLNESDIRFIVSELNKEFI